MDYTLLFCGFVFVVSTGFIIYNLYIIYKIKKTMREYKKKLNKLYGPISGNDIR